jgi:hypothetical protein
MLCWQQSQPAADQRVQWWLLVCCGDFAFAKCRPCDPEKCSVHTSNMLLVWQATVL